MEKPDTTEQKIPERIESLDILRGFDMFWIIGGGSLVISLAAATEWGWLEAYWGGWVIVGVIILEWLLPWYLYKNKIFLRI